MANVYNRIYTEQKWEQVNKFNKNLLADYIAQIKSEGKSEGTVKQYLNNARIVMIYVLEELDNKPMYKLTRKHFRNFVLYLQENGLSPARINSLLTISRNLLNFGMEDEDYEEEFEDTKLRPDRIKGMQKEKRRDIVFLSDKEVHLIIEGFIEKKRYQQALFIALAYDSCSRRNELYQLKRSDLSVDSNISVSKVRGKRGKEYRPMYNDLTKRVLALVEEHRTDDTDYLWTTKSNGEVVEASYESLYAWVMQARKILEEKTGEYKEFNAHSFRHSTAQNLKDGSHYLCKKMGGALDLDIIQKLMNHSDISTTQSYLKQDDEGELLAVFGA